MNNSIKKYNRNLFSNILKAVLIIIVVAWLASCKKEQPAATTEIQPPYKFLQIEAVSQDSTKITSEVEVF